MVGVTWDVETQEWEYVYRYLFFNFLEKTLKLMIYSTLWASDMEIQNVWFVIIPICIVRNKKTSSFYLNYKYVLWTWVVDRSTGRIPHKKRVISKDRYKNQITWPACTLFFDRLGVSREKPQWVGFFSVFLTEASRFQASQNKKPHPLGLFPRKPPRCFMLNKKN